MIIADRYSLTPLQQVMLYESLKSEDPSTYVAQIRYRLTGSLDTDLFRQAWATVRARHETLRSSIVTEPDGTHRLAISVPEDSEFTLVAPVNSDCDADELAAADVARGFDLNGESLHRLAVVPLPHNDWEVRWSSHHIAIDGWSIPIVVSELFANYAALAGAGTPTLPPAGAYGSYIDWLAEIDDTRGEEHWRKVLSGVVDPTPLPMHRPSTTTIGAANITIERIIDLDASSALDSFCRSAKVTLSTAVQAAWAAVLAAYADREDVLFGVTTSGRPAELAGAEDIVGMLITTIPHRVRIPARAQVGPWLSTVQREFTRSRAFEHISPQAIRRASGLTGQQPLYESILVVENYPTAAEAAPSGFEDVLRIVDATSVERLRFPLLVTLSRTEESALRVELSFDPSRLDSDTADGILAGFCELLTSLDAAEPVRALVGRVPRSAPLPTTTAAPDVPLRDRILHELRQRGDAEALVAATGTWSAAKLLARAAQLTELLRARGVRPGDRVAAIGPRDPELIALMLACWSAGAAYAPLDPSAPVERLRAMIDQLSPACVIALDAELREKLPGALPLPEHGVDPAPRAPAPAPAPLPANSIAYIVHTSGTSGLPKPVAVSHQAVGTAVTGWTAAFDLANRTHRHLHSNAPSFDVAIGEVCRALTVGAVLVVAPPDTEKDVEELLDLIDNEQVDVVDLPPGLLRPLLYELDLRGTRLDSLDLVFVGGEQWFRSDRDQLLAATAPKVRIVNAYGVSEAAIDSAFAVDAAPGRSADRALDLTTAYAGVSVDVRTHGLTRVPPGATGEIAIAGATLADGYLRDPRRTALTFVPDPYANGKRLYRTGDRGTLSSRGRLTVLGRKDEQLKHNGHRIEPEEIESVLHELPGVTESCLVKRDARLVAFVTGSEKLDTSSLRESLGARLPRHLIPHLIQIQTLPRTTTGKIDRRAVETLPLEPTGQRIEPLQTTAEHAVASAWSAVIDASTLGPDDDFFELGGDSIAALRVVGALKAQGWTTRVGTLMAAPMLREFAQQLQRSETDQPSRRLPAGTVVPLSATQRLLLENTPDPAWYDLGLAWRIGRPVTSERVEAAIHATVAHHTAFALRYRRGAAGWEQHIAGPEDGAAAVTITKIDLRAEPTPPIGTRTPGFRSTLSIEDGPLIHCEIRQHADDTVLVIAVNHLIVDIYSWDVLLRGVLGELGGQPTLGPIQPGWPEYQLEAAERTARGELDELIPRWIELLGDPEPIPRDAPDGRNDVGSVERVEVRIPNFAASAGAGTADEVALIAALGRAYHAWSGVHLYLLLEAHGRNDPGTRMDLSSATGWFTAITPVLFPIDATDTPARSATLVAERLSALPEPRASIDWLASGGRSSDLAAIPWPEISLNYLGTVTRVEEITGAYELDANDWDGIDPRHRRDVLIEIEALREDTTLVIEILYSSEIHRPSSVATLSNLLQTELLAAQESAHLHDTKKGT